MQAGKGETKMTCTMEMLELESQKEELKNRILRCALIRAFNGDTAKAIECLEYTKAIFDDDISR